MVLWIILEFIWIANFSLRITALKGTKGNKAWIAGCLFFILFLCPINIIARANLSDNKEAPEVKEELVTPTLEVEKENESIEIEEKYYIIQDY